MGIELATQKKAEVQKQYYQIDQKKTQKVVMNYKKGLNL